MTSHLGCLGLPIAANFPLKCMEMCLAASILIRSSRNELHYYLYLSTAGENVTKLRGDNKPPHLLSMYCKTLNISVPLMLAKLAMRYHSLTFVVAKINVYCYTCAVVCHVLSTVENCVLPVQLVAERKTVVPFAAKF